MLNTLVWLPSHRIFLVLSVQPVNKCYVCVCVCGRCQHALYLGYVLGHGIRYPERCPQSSAEVVFGPGPTRSLPRCMEQPTTQLFKQSMRYCTSASPTSLLKSNNSPICWNLIAIYVQMFCVYECVVFLPKEHVHFSHICRRWRIGSQSFNVYSFVCVSAQRIWVRKYINRDTLSS